MSMDSLFDSYAPDAPDSNRGLRIAIVMATAAAVLIGVVLFFARDHVTSTFRAQAVIAVDSLTRVQDASGDGAMWYQPRLIEAEKAVDAAKRAASTDSDRELSQSLDTWLKLTELHDTDALSATATCDAHVHALLAGGSADRGACERAFTAYVQRPAPAAEWHRN